MADPLIATQSPNSTYQRKVVIVRTASTFPFMSDDFAFLGRCSDLRQMTMQEESLLIHNPRSAPTAEMMWMYAALSRRFPLLDAFFSMAPLRQFSLQLRKTSQQSIAQIPDLVLGFLSYYWQINADHYEIIRKKNFEYETDTVKAILNPVEQSPLARDLGMYITVHADGVLQCAAGALKCLQNTVLSCNPTEVVSTMIESLCPSTKEANVVPIVKLACGETSPNVQEKSALATALQYHQHTQENIADIDALEKIILECGNKIAFPRLIAQIGLKYCHGSDDLPKHTELGRAWLRLAAGMREPSAFRELVHSYPSDEEAIMDAEIQRIFALQETRDPDIFVRLCRAFLFKGVTHALP
ncbi:hypothetical protein MVG78_07370 [Roseomonas gilardii subsp. gilardii]|uniref:hypothetical protein n=1 Tax=Roseomonas gilardii TaxID=257708 RepID=UPI001FFB3553|nr:hypothetical protein [Roseomonas gilardii]UPG73943.1 hypothetical protein MVG78_07370 [Roseomonas gilardii subsp. gilardii]